MTVVLVEAKSAADNSLANQVIAISEALLRQHRPGVRRQPAVARWVVGIDEVIRSKADNRLGNSIAVAVIDISGTAAVQRSQPILEIVSVAVSIRRRGVAVVVVVLARQTIISIIG